MSLLFSLLPLALGVFLAGTVNGATGLGFAIIASAAVALVLDAKIAVIMLSVMVPVLSGMQLFRHRAEIKHGRRILPLFVSGLFGVPLGTYILAVLSVQAITLVLGAFTILYVVTSFYRLRLKVSPRWEPLLSPVVGFTGGVCGGAIGVAGPILASYLLALEIPPSTFVFALAWMFTTNSLTRLVSLFTLEQLTPGMVGLGLLLLPAGAVGVLLGMWLQKRLPQLAFQRAVLAVLFVAGLNLVQRGLA